MTVSSRTITDPLIDTLRPKESEGVLESLVMSTYGLSLDQSNFFEFDFLPTLLGLSGARDRGYTKPITMERKLRETRSTLITDSHSLTDGSRPSLQIDILPVSQRTNHAKIVLIHRKRFIRLIISSANLTHDGYRNQREIAVVLDFMDKGSIPFEVLDQALARWSEVLGPIRTDSLNKTFDEIIHSKRTWTSPAQLPNGQKVEVVFGGGLKPLWKSLVEAWPIGEPLLDWCVCSPFWPDESGGETPFEVICRGLVERDVNFEKARLQIITCADSQGEKARPIFPFHIVKRLNETGFPIRKGFIAAARLDTLADEIPEGMEGGNRNLHAKWVLLRGPNTSVILMGSANFTRKGLGAGIHPEKANIEACALLTLPASMVSPSKWMGPLATKGMIDLEYALGNSQKFKEPPLKENKNPPWPDFIIRIEFETLRQHGPDPTGVMHVILTPGPHPSFTIHSIKEKEHENELNNAPLLSIGAGDENQLTRISAPADSQAVRLVLIRRFVKITWGESHNCAQFPININDESKSELPSVLGMRPDEQQLLAYFHGRISEEDLIELLHNRAEQLTSGTTVPPDSEKQRKLQNYIIREFVESLFGLADTLRFSTRSPRAFDHALIGEFSPLSLAEQVLQAFLAGRRSPTAAAFQLVELIQVVANLKLEGKEIRNQGEIETLEEIRNRCVNRLLKIAKKASEQQIFRQTCLDQDFSSYVEASLGKYLAKKWEKIIEEQKEENLSTQPLESRSQN